MAGGRPYRGHALIAVVGFSGYRSAKVQAQADAVTKEMEARVSSAIRWAGLTETNAARTQALIVSSDPAVELEFKDVIAATSAQISEVQKSMEGMALSEQDRAQMAKIAAARKTMTELRAQARQLKADGQAEQAVALVKQSYNPAVSAYLQTLGDFVQMQQQTAQTTLAEMTASRMLTVKMAAVAVGALLLACVTLTVAPEDHALLASLGDDLKFVFITSTIELIAGSALQVSAKASFDAKCERCWHYSADVGHDAAHPTLCGRCTSNLFGSGEDRKVA